jgi:hypothetical protein
MRDRLITILTEEELCAVPLNFFNASVSPFKKQMDTKIIRENATCKLYQDDFYRTYKFLKPILKI